MFPAKFKNLNVVVVEENYLDIDDIIEYCVSESISLELMFELKKYSFEDYRMQRYVFEKLAMYGGFSINLSCTPIITHRISDACRISIKHPYLSRLLNRDMCNDCTDSHNCFERVCAVRVHPNATVTPCLNHKVVSHKENLDGRIDDAYAQLINNFSILSFLTK